MGFVFKVLTFGVDLPRFNSHRTTEAIEAI